MGVISGEGNSLAPVGVGGFSIDEKALTKPWKKPPIPVAFQRFLWHLPALFHLGED